MFPKNIKNLDIIKYPNKILRKISIPLEKKFFNTNKLNEFLDQMIKITEKYDGIGLAAPQIGVNLQIIYLQPNKKEKFFLINPKIYHFSEQQILEEEGCLSLPNIFGKVLRPEEIIVQGFNPQGERIEINTGKLLARIIQHEIDHLNGILFIDKVIKFTQGEHILKELQQIEKYEKTKN